MQFFLSCLESRIAFIYFFTSYIVQNSNISEKLAIQVVFKLLWLLRFVLADRFVSMAFWSEAERDKSDNGFSIFIN